MPKRDCANTWSRPFASRAATIPSITSGASPLGSPVDGSPGRSDQPDHARNAVSWFALTPPPSFLTKIQKRPFPPVATAGALVQLGTVALGVPKQSSAPKGFPVAFCATVQIWGEPNIGGWGNRRKNNCRWPPFRFPTAISGATGPYRVGSLPSEIGPYHLLLPGRT